MNLIHRKLFYVFIIFHLEIAESCRCKRKVPENRHGIAPLTIINHDEEIKRSTVKAVIPRMSIEWSIRLTLQITGINQPKDWCNVIHLTEDSDSDRLPSLFFNEWINQLRIYFPGRDQSWPYETTLSLHTNYTIEIHQRYKSGGKYQFIATVNGDEIVNVESPQAASVQRYDVKIYASNPWFASCIGIIKDFRFTNFL
uniref:Cnidarian restricted protein n=1 Tax=Clytia hemisphaerica TaxID=252671 RepID=A0A7M5X670_9CNID